MVLRMTPTYGTWEEKGHRGKSFLLFWEFHESVPLLSNPISFKDPSLSIKTK
jgi:hypothetical protein